jgi:hypothetical protein
MVPGKAVHDRPGGHPRQNRLFELIPETGYRSKDIKNNQKWLQSYVTYDTLLRRRIP